MNLIIISTKQQVKLTIVVQITNRYTTTNVITGDDIRGGISVCDLNNDGQLDLLFGGYDDKIHVWDPVANELLSGWPVDVGFNILSEPLIADLDQQLMVQIKY